VSVSRIRLRKAFVYIFPIADYLAEPKLRVGENIRKIVKKGFPLHWAWCNNGGPRIALANLRFQVGPKYVDR
jgi:hypothetical protein